MIMGEVVNTLKVMPESPEVDLEALKAAITDAMPADAELHEITEEPIAFGLVSSLKTVKVELDLLKKQSLL